MLGFYGRKKLIEIIRSMSRKLKYGLARAMKKTCALPHIIMLSHARLRYI